MSITVPGSIDFCSAKEMRFRSWAEKVGYVRYMRIYMNWWPGGVNDWADLLSRIADKLAECAEERERLAMVMPLQVHSYHTGHRTREKESGVPSGYRVEHLNLSEDGWEEVHRAYLEDTESKVQGTKLSDVYRVVTMGGEGVDPGVQANIRPWAGKRMFAVVPPGAKRAMLYTPRSQLRVHGEDDNTQVLVLCVPEGANVRMTTGEAPPDEGHEWSKLDLKRDMCVYRHEFDSHSKAEEMQAKLRALCWFPGLLLYVKNHIKMCGHCSARAAAEVSAGTGIEAMRRGEVAQMDHRVLTTEEKKIGFGYVAILTITDVASRKVMFEPVDSESALDTAYVILMDWVPENGVPAMFISDPGSGFASEVMACLMKLVGVKKHDVKERNAKGPVSVVERKHRGLNVCLDDAVAVGRITCRREFRLVCKEAQSKENQYARPGHSSHFELWTGQRPRTVQSLVTVAEEMDSLPKVMSTSDREQVEKIKEHCERLVKYEFEIRDEVARANNLRRDKELGVSPQVTRFDLRVGDMVNYDGNKAEVMELAGPPGQPQTATVKLVSGKVKAVQYRDLRPMGVERPRKEYPRSGVIEEGSFVVFSEPDNEEIQGGVVSSVIHGDARYTERADALGPNLRSMYPCVMY